MFGAERTAVAGRVLGLAAALVFALGVALGTAGTPASIAPGRAPAVAPNPTSGACAPAWTTAWQAAGQPMRGGAALSGTTLRMIVQPKVTGSEVRVRLANTYGTTPLTLGTVSVARSDGAAGLVPDTARQVTFGGESGVVLVPGAEGVSDAVPLVSEVGRPLAVSLFLPAAPQTLTGHAVALQTSYLSRPGDVALEPDGAAFDTPTRSWLVLAGVDVLAPRPVNAVVAVGDSITDGVGSETDADERWSDALAARMSAAGGAVTMPVLNAGISRNRLLAPVRAVDSAEERAEEGDPPLARFDRDVTASAGVTDVVLHVGTNDLADGRGTGEIVAGFREFADRTRATGRRVFLTTITPSDTGAHGTPGAIAARDAVNAWVREQGPAYSDGVFDFAAAVADPGRPARLAPAFDSGDGLHLSPAGYSALAAAVDPVRFTGSPCLADTSPARIAVSGR